LKTTKPSKKILDIYNEMNEKFATLEKKMS